MDRIGIFYFISQLSKLRPQIFKSLASDCTAYKELALNSCFLQKAIEMFQLHCFLCLGDYLLMTLEALHLLFCLFCFQFKKHRLSVVHTNTYAKSVVNMADLVSINWIQYCHRGISSPDC